MKTTQPAKKTSSIKKKECCEALEFVMKRCAAAKQPQGIYRDLLFLFNKSPPTPRYAVIVRLPRGARDDKDRNVVYRVLNYCPFCGKKLELRSAT